MSKPRSPETIEAAEYVSIAELSTLSGFRYSTLKHYTEIGILEFTQQDTGLKRWYKKKESLERLVEIKYLKIEKRYTIQEIVDYFNKKD